MQSTHVYSKLTEIFRDVFDDDTIELNPNTTAADISGWDSVGHLNLIVAIEMRLKIKFKAAEIESLHNVGELAGLVEYKLEQAEGTAAR